MTVETNGVCSGCGATLMGGFVHICGGKSTFGGIGGGNINVTGQYWPPIPAISAYGKVIAVEPFPAATIEKKENHAFSTAAQKTVLSGLKVIYGNAEIAAGCTVYVAGDLYTLPFAKFKFRIADGPEVIFLPIEHVKLVQQPERK